MYIQYVGVGNSVGSRIYTFHVINPPQEAREFTVKVRSEEFSADRLKFQDGPGISSARLQRELKGKTQESRAEAELCIEEQDVPGIPSPALPTHKVCGRNGQVDEDSPCLTAARKAFPEPRVLVPGIHSTSCVRRNLDTAPARTRRLSGRAEIGPRSAVCECVLLAESPGSSASADGTKPAAPDFHPAQAPGRHLGGRGELGVEGPQARERHRRGAPGEYQDLPPYDHRGRV